MLTYENLYCSTMKDILEIIIAFPTGLYCCHSAGAVPQGLAITAWAFDTTNRALGGGDGTVVVRVVLTLDASDM